MPVAFQTVVEKITEAARQVDADEGASPVLVAVVHEFRSKLAKAEGSAREGVAGRDAVLELEQAGDSAKAAAEADAGLSNDSRESVLAAHLAICMLKQDTLPSVLLRAVGCLVEGVGSRSASAFRVAHA